MSKKSKKGLMQQLFPAEGEAVPKLRFPEFRDMGGWENKSIGEVTTVIAGATPSTNNPNYWGGDIPWMNSGELNLKRVYKVSNGITALGLKETSTKLIPLSCILIGLAGQGKTRGTVAINYIELCTNQSIATILPNIYEFVSEFLFHKLDSMYFYLRSLSKGEGGRGGLNLQIIKSVKISLPRLEEQQKIADCLSSIDDLITAQAKKIESLKDHKKGLMQQLFPAEGETVPKLRFPEFSMDWKVKSLEQLANIKTGGKDKEDKVNDGLYPFFVRSKTVEKINSFSYDGEAILTSGDGGVGKDFHYINGKFDFHQRVYCIFKFKNQVFGKYIYFYFSEKFNKRVMRMSAKNTVDSVRMDMVTKMKICIPTLIEQQKIADCLSSIDDLITAQAKKIELLKDHKKGLMQQLFPVDNEGDM